MEFTLEGTGIILSRTPQLLRTLLDGLPKELLRASYGPNTWSPHEVVGHLIHGEKTDWMPRVRLILRAGEAVAFEPFDRNGHTALCREKSTGELLVLFESLRNTNLAELRTTALKPADLARRGRHPALGQVTLSQLLATWVVHDLNHVAQICKALSFQHQHEVGPWEAYLSILAPPSPR
jgi:DinB superfamily